MKTDSPLKLAVRYNPEDFCSWVLGEEVVEATFQDRELARDPKKYFLDSLLKVITAKGQERLVHIEFQGANSHIPMGVRMLMYFAMLAEYYGKLTIPIDIVVIYVGKGAGRNDTGDHTLGLPQLGTFSYRVIHLWQYEAADILASDHPTLLSLIGQSKFSDAQQEVEAAFEKIVTLSDAETRENLTHVLTMLLPEKKLVERIITMATEYGLLMDTPYMQMIRQEKERLRQEKEREKEAEFARGMALGKDAGWQKGRQEGIAEGREEGHKEGISRGREEGQKEGSAAARRHDIIDILQTRFGIGAQASQSVLERLSILSNPILADTLRYAVTCKDMDSFTTWLDS